MQYKKSVIKYVYFAVQYTQNGIMHPSASYHNEQ
jgi:hypothetical protein